MPPEAEAEALSIFTFYKELEGLVYQVAPGDPELPGGGQVDFPDQAGFI